MSKQQTNMIKSSEFNAYQKYIKYVDSLIGMARYPYTTIVENPPDLLMEYRRKLTFDEFRANKYILSEFLKKV